MNNDLATRVGRFVGEFVWFILMLFVIVLSYWMGFKEGQLFLIRDLTNSGKLAPVMTTNTVVQTNYNYQYYLKK